jgi:hypothetical protein
MDQIIAMSQNVEPSQTEFLVRVYETELDADEFQLEAEVAVRRV